MLRLDFNENTIGPSPAVAEALRAFSADQIAIYPEYDGLREAVIRNLQASPAGLAHELLPQQVGLFNGVDAAIHAVIHAYGAPGDTLLTTSPTFGYYAPCAGMQGMVVEAVPHVLPGFLFPLPLLFFRQGCVCDSPRLDVGGKVFLYQVSSPLFPPVSGPICRPSLLSFGH